MTVLFDKIWRFVRRYPLGCLCVAAIWYLCLFKPPRVPEVEDMAGFDKVVHVTMYLGTCGVIWWEYFRAHRKERWGRIVSLAIVGPILMSGIIELVQAYCTESRSGDWMDFLANTTGVLLAAALGHFCIRRRCVKPENKTR